MAAALDLGPLQISPQDSYFKFPSGNTYILISHIGHGNHGVVYECVEIHTHRKCAIKFAENLEIEAKNHKRINGFAHVMPLWEFSTDVVCYDAYLKKSNKVNALVMPLLGKDMHKEHRRKKIPLKELKLILRQLLTLLRGIGVHGDLKPSNLFWDSVEKKLTAGDFSHAIELRELIFNIQNKAYRSPEVKAKQKYDATIEMWSSGLMAIEWYLGLGFYNSKYSDIDEELISSDLMRFFADQFGPLPVQWGIQLDGIGPLYEDLNDFGSWKNRIRHQGRMNRDNPAQVENLISLLSQMMVYENRINAAQALEHPFFNDRAGRNDPQPGQQASQGGCCVIL